MIGPYLTGLGVGAGLIIAIGAQNAFVLSQGIRRTSLLIVPLICSLSDALLITIGIAGVGRLLSVNPLVLKLAAAGGSLFLIWYGLRSFRSFLKKERLEEQEPLRKGLGKTAAYTLAVTFLNPHVYLDTMLFIGSISTQFSDESRIYFGAGAVSASFLWFFTLSWGGRLLAPVFKNPLSWKILDLVLALIMWYIAITLILGSGLLRN